MNEKRIYKCQTCSKMIKDKMENDHLKQMESIYIKETHMIDNLYSKYCSGLKNAEF